MGHANANALIHNGLGIECECAYPRDAPNDWDRGSSGEASDARGMVVVTGGWSSAVLLAGPFAAQAYVALRNAADGESLPYARRHGAGLRDL